MAAEGDTTMTITTTATPAEDARLTRPSWCPQGHPSASNCECHCCWLGHAYAADPERYRHAAHLFRSRQPT